MEQISVVVTGSLAFDHIMNLPGSFSDYILPDKIHSLNVSFLVDTLQKEFGGTGGNIAYNLALFGIKVKLVAAIGSDGDDYVVWLRQNGVNVTQVKKFSDILTASGFVMTDRKDNQIWSFYSGAMRKANKLQVTTNKRQDKKPDLVIIAPNDPQAMMAYAKECQKKNWDYLFDPAFYIPTLSRKDLAMAVRGAKIVIGNDYEITLLQRKVNSNQLSVNSNQIQITTLGEEGSVVRQGGIEYKVPAAKPKKVVDPTGAGDAYRAGFVAGYLQGLAPRVCGRMGAVCAAYTVEKYGTQTHKFSLRGFNKRYATNFGR